MSGGPRGRAAPLLKLLGLALTVGFGLSFAHFLDRMDAGGGEASRHAEGAVALTGGPDRIAEAVEILARGEADRLLITGVNPLTTRAHLVRQTPQARALFDCCIELGYEAANTVGNAEETERWARAHHIRSLIVVTSNYHMPRALAEIGSVLPDVDLIAYPVVTDRDRERPWWGDGQRARLVVMEYLKYLVVRLRLSVTPPKADPPRQAAAE